MHVGDRFLFKGKTVTHSCQSPCNEWCIGKVEKNRNFLRIFTGVAYWQCNITVFVTYPTKMISHALTNLHSINLNYDTCSQQRQPEYTKCRATLKSKSSPTPTPRRSLPPMTSCPQTTSFLPPECTLLLRRRKWEWACLLQACPRDLNHDRHRKSPNISTVCMPYISTRLVRAQKGDKCPANWLWRIRLREISWTRVSSWG